MDYLTIKALHIIGVTAWFAGLFYIFRLYVYHVENSGTAAVAQVLTTMERRLYYAITWPAMVFALTMGGALLALNPGLLASGWFRVKLACLVPLFAYHFFAGHVRKRFARAEYFLTSRQCRFINEVPTLVLLAVVPLAVIKPF